MRVEAHVESRVEIDRVWGVAQQAVQLGAATGGAGSCWLERSVREVVRGKVERLEREHIDAVVDGGALRRAAGGPGGVRRAHGAKVCGAKANVGSAGAWGKERGERRWR